MSGKGSSCLVQHQQGGKQVPFVQEEFALSSLSSLATVFHSQHSNTCPSH